TSSCPATWSSATPSGRRIEPDPSQRPNYRHRRRGPHPACHSSIGDTSMRSFFLGTLAAAAALGCSAPAQAQDAQAWPAKNIQYIVPFSPGGVSDGVARLLAEQLGARLGQSVIIENKPGVSGIVGTQLAARAKPDGYTIAGGTITTHAVNPFFIKSLGYDPVKDFTPVALVGMVSNALVVRADSPFDSVQQVIDAARARPDELTYGTAGAGTSQHLSGQLFQSISHTR